MTISRYIRKSGGWVPLTGTTDTSKYVFYNSAGSVEAIDLTSKEMSVKSRAATDITDSSAKLRGEMTQMVNIEGVDVSFSWEIAGEEPVTSNTNTQTINSATTFSDTVTGLNPATIYEFWIVAETATDSVMSGVKTFTTKG